MRQRGTVDRWDAERGFGFIRCEGRSVFFHVRDYRGTGAGPRLGDGVSFEEIHVGGKGPRAMMVRPGHDSVPSAAAATAARPPARRDRPEGALAAGARATASGSSRRPQPSPANPAGLALTLMAAWAVAVGVATWQRRLPVAWLLFMPVLNGLTFFVYAWDKDAARQGRWRVRELHLHALALAGGWPGAWWAQQLLRHKSLKPSFRAMYWLTVALHIAGLAAWLQRHRLGF